MAICQPSQRETTQRMRTCEDPLPTSCSRAAVTTAALRLGGGFCMWRDQGRLRPSFTLWTSTNTRPRFHSRSWGTSVAPLIAVQPLFHSWPGHSTCHLDRRDDLLSTEAPNDVIECLAYPFIVPHAEAALAANSFIAGEADPLPRAGVPSKSAVAH
jgi:hypothetical protein